MEKIIKIEEIENYKSGYHEMDGFKVTTDKQEILLLISNGQSCCESWGYFSSSDDLEDFVGANLISIEKVNDSLSKEVLGKQNTFGWLSEDAIYFLNINTDTKGTLQLAVYNSHNGYYGHQVKIISKELNESMYL